MSIDLLHDLRYPHLAQVEIYFLAVLCTDMLACILVLNKSPVHD
jgi:hypothetical protein